MTRLLLLTAAIVVSGCVAPSTGSNGTKPCARTWPQAHTEGPVRVAMYDTTARCPSAECRVFQPGETVPPHKVIALMTCGGHARDEGTFIGSMIIHAKRLGATGFVLLPYESPNSTVALAHPIWQNPGDRVYRGNAIILTETNTP